MARRRRILAAALAPAGVRLRRHVVVVRELVLLLRATELLLRGGQRRDELLLLLLLERGGDLRRAPVDAGPRPDHRRALDPRAAVAALAAGPALAVRHAPVRIWPGIEAGERGGTTKEAQYDLPVLM